MADKNVLTHHVAVAAYIFFQEKLLLLKRANPPFTFAPPGGSLEPSEDPIQGVLREILEETNLQIEIVGVAHTWFGKIADDHPPLLCINYLAVPASSEIQLSSEHTEFVWITREELMLNRVKTLNEQGKGYQLKDILDAFDRFAKLSANQ